MPNEIMQEITTTTVRRNFIGGASPERRESLAKEGWYLDRLANQYRQTRKVEKLYVDGVEVERIGEVAGDSATAPEKVNESDVANKSAA